MENIESKRRIKSRNGITLVALVVTIVVLLILAGVTISYVMGDNSVFKKASDAKLQTDIAQWQERLELAKSPVFIEGLGTFNADKYFDYIQQQGIINSKDTDVIDNEDGTYDVTTKPGYIFEVALIPSPEKPTDAEITYIGQAGKILPIIKKLEVSATSTSITGKAIVSRLGNGTVKYYYKLKTENDSEYKEITSVNAEIGATQNTGITAGEEYIIKVVAKNDAGEVEKTAEITATKVFVESITLNKTEEVVAAGKTVTLTATVKPDDATNKNVTWESSNTAVATVSDTGVVTGKTAGTATITVKATDGSDKTATCVITVTITTVADVVDQVQTSNREVQDENGNKITIPGGFKVVPDIHNNNVDYTYNGDKKPCVQDGIVIEDEEENQFVWVPVGNIKNKDGTTANITLGRYTFDYNEGTPLLWQNATDFSSTVPIQSGSYSFQELLQNTTDSYTNQVSTHLSKFINISLSKGGYYLGRYEASKGSDEKVDSKSGKLPWVNITQLNAATEARRMYSSNYVLTDLINSYSWDTAIVFIQQYSDKSNYANNAFVTNNGIDILNTGSSRDKICNIYDMAINCKEYSTEHFTQKENYAVLRGGTTAEPRASLRTPTSAIYNLADYYSFRVVMFVQ